VKQMTDLTKLLDELLSNDRHEQATAEVVNELECLTPSVTVHSPERVTVSAGDYSAHVSADEYHPARACHVIHDPTGYEFGNVPTEVFEPQLSQSLTTARTTEDRGAAAKEAYRYSRL